MHITTKYDLQQLVFFMLDNKIKSGVIIGILITIGDERLKEKYIYNIPRYNIYVSNETSYRNYPEDILFSSKSDLLKSL